VTRKLHRYYGAQHLHFITCSCYRRQSVLGTAERRDRFLNILEEARSKFRFVVHGYVVMPEHFHLLITEPEVGDPSVVMKVIKERFSKQVHASEESSRKAHSCAENANEWGTHADPKAKERIWQKRFYDFNVWSAQKQTEKLKYMHRNPVKRGLVERPEQWPWSSFRAYLYSETGPVRVRFQEGELEIKPRPVQSLGRVDSPLIRTERE
jgi:putative transposase